MSCEVRCDGCLALSAICIRLRQLKKMSGPERLVDTLRFPRAYSYDTLLAVAKKMTAKGHRVKYRRWKGRRP